MQESRQVRRANARRQAKAQRRHQNEVVKKANVRKRNSFPFLTRADYRKFLSSKCPAAFAAWVAATELMRVNPEAA